MSSKTSVLLTAGFNRAMHVLALAELLRRQDVRIEGLLIVSPYTWQRLRVFVRQRGRQALWQALPRLFGVHRVTDRAEGPDALVELMQQQGIEAQSLRKWARTHDVPVHIVPSLNDATAVARVASVRPTWVIYGGGGILRDAFIEAAGERILNAHSGPLPEIRGMNACEWSLLLGYAPSVTIHLINRGIDTGGILSSHPVPVQPNDTIDVLRSRCVAIGVDALRKTVLDPPGRLPRSRENADVHRQCFVLAPAMRELVEKRLAEDVYAPLYSSYLEDRRTV